MLYLWSYSAAWLTTGFLMVCAVTDVLYRRVSETMIFCGSLAVLLLHFSWVSLVFAVLCAALWVLSSLNDIAWGDVEMAFLTGLGLGPLGVVAIFISCLLALLAKPLWPRLSSRHTPPAERHLAPVGLFLAMGAILAVLMKPWLVAGLQAYVAYLAIHAR